MVFFFTVSSFHCCSVFSTKYWPLILFPELEEFGGEVAQDDGRFARHQLKNVSKEIAAHRLLLSEMTEIIHKYDASIKASTSTH